MADEELGTGVITITLDGGAAEAEAERLGDRIERALNRASRDAGLRVEQNINAAVRRINPVRIQVETDLDRFDAAIRAHRTPTVTAEVDLDTDRFTRALGRLGSIAAGTGRALGGLLGFGALGIAAAGATQSVIGLSAALAPAAGLLAGIPAAALTAGAALGTLGLALSGVGDALGAALVGDTEKFNEALEQLSPAAQSAARALGPALEEVRTSVQQAFFQQIAGGVDGLAKSLKGPLLAGLTNIASAWGTAAKGALDYVQSASGVQDVQSVLAAARLGVEGLAASTSKLTSGFLQAAAVVSDAFGERFANALSNTAVSFGTFLENAATSGKAVEWVDEAVGALFQLGSVLSNAGDILSGVFRAGNEAGAGFLNNLEAITQSFSDFVNSDPGQAALGGFFATLGAVASQLGPILAALVTQLGNLGTALAPVFETLGPAIADLINSLGPALAQIAPGVQAVASGLSEAIAGLGDTGALEDLGKSIGDALASIGPALPGVVSALASLAQSAADLLIPLAPLTGLLLQVVAPVIDIASPLIIAAAAFLGLVKGVRLALSVVPALQVAWAGLNAVFIASPLGVIAAAVVALGLAVFLLYQRFAPVREAVDGVGNALKTAFQETAGFVQTAITAVKDFISSVGEFFTSLPGKIGDGLAAAGVAIASFLASLPGLVLSGLKFLADSFVTGLAFSLGVIVGFFIKLPGRIASAITTIRETLVTAFTTAFQATKSFISNAITTVVGFFTRLPGRIKSALTALPGQMASAFRSARDATVRVVTGLVSDTVGLIRALPGKAKAALGNAGSALSSAGRALVDGFVSGIKAKVGEVAAAASRLVDRAKAAFKAGLDFGSPSKVFIEIGKFTGQGFALGLLGTEATIRDVAERLISKLRAVFRGRVSGLEVRLIEQVRSTNTRLQALAKQRNAIADQIKKANETAASVTQAALSAFSLQDLAQGGGGVQGLTDGIDSAVRQINKFDQQINALARRGLRKDLLSQIIGLGPEQGAALASTLNSATSAQLKELNNAQKQLTAASKKLGRDSADNLFDAGKEASKGFLAGLKDQQEDIEDLMLSIARSLARSIRAALGIKSPSKVFRGIGRLTMDGLSVGVEDRMRSVRRSVLGAASAITDPFGGAPSIGSVGVTGGRPAGTQGASGRSVVNHWTINEVGDGEATARRVLSRMALAGGGL